MIFNEVQNNAEVINRFIFSRYALATEMQQVPENILNRKFPVSNERAYRIKDSTTYYLSEGMSMSLTNNDSTIINSDFGSYKSTLHYSAINKSINYVREFQMNKFYFSPDRYDDLRKFLTQVFHEDKKNAVILMN